MTTTDIYPSREEYVERMKRSRQFRMFRVEPAWRPGEKDIDGFIYDEVVRQFHNVNTEEGRRRIPWMKAAWEYARGQAERERFPSLDDVLHIGALIEPEYNSNGFRSGRVWVGDGEKLDPAQVPRAMASLFTTVQEVTTEQGQTGYYRSVRETSRIDNPTADDFYLQFEEIHPFSDGNGRSGKIIHNWLLGTLDNPHLVRDYYGQGNP